MPEREPLPSWADWSDQAEALGLRLRSGELKGPCPSCGGTDRFHIRRSGPDARVGCRGCIDGGGTGFGAVIRAVFPERFDTIGSPSISHTLRQTPKSPQPADTGPDPLVAQLWTRAVPPDPTPGRLYLALRFAWPPHGIGPNLPTTVRWLDVQAARRRCPMPDGSDSRTVQPVPWFSRGNDLQGGPGCDEPRSTRHGRPANRAAMAPHVRDTGRDGVRGAGAVERDGPGARCRRRSGCARARPGAVVSRGRCLRGRRYVGDAH